jgi:hypothetical protein
MTLEEYRRTCGWSIQEMAREAHMDFNTMKKALSGVAVSPKTGSRIAEAISKKLGQTVRVPDISGLNVKF